MRFTLWVLVESKNWISWESVILNRLIGLVSPCSEWIAWTRWSNWNASGYSTQIQRVSRAGSTCALLSTILATVQLLYSAQIGTIHINTSHSHLPLYVLLYVFGDNTAAMRETSNNWGKAAPRESSRSQLGDVESKKTQEPPIQRLFNVIVFNQVNAADLVPYLTILLNQNSNCLI
jgi:hypothetical protein